jgi:hypothetical protein
MRKTLLIAAAALATSVISSQAQGAVYSQNIVGYVNIPVTNGVAVILSPALDADGTGTNNTISTVFTTPAYGDTVYVFNGTGYDTIQYTKINLGGHPPVYTTNWAIGSTISSTYAVNPGQSMFYVPAASQTITEVGVALTGSVANQYVPAAGKVNLVASKSPVSGGLTSVLGYQPIYGDTVYVFANGGYTTYTYGKVNLGGHPPVYTTNWAVGSTVGEPVISVGQGFWLQSAGANTWTEVVNP